MAYAIVQKSWSAELPVVTIRQTGAINISDNRSQFDVKEVLFYDQM